MKKTEIAINTLDKHFRGYGWLLIALFLPAFLCWGLFSGFVAFRILLNGGTTEGEVIRINTPAGSPLTYTAVVEYEVNGQTHSVEDDVTTSNSPRFELGEKVTILYDRANPAAARVVSPFIWLFP